MEIKNISEFRNFEVAFVKERNRNGTCKECLRSSNGFGDKKAACYHSNYCPATI